ncbi:MAG: glycosyltransferase [Terriglobales bacterium]|jgi:glycosyltransferase involved in cell wall biosynthesis
MVNHKVLVVGPLNQTALAESYARAFERLGMEVDRFDSDRAIMQASRFTGNRIVRRVLRSSLWNAVNHEVVEVAERVRPALIFAVKCSFFHPETIRQIRKATGVPFVNHYPDHPYIGIRWDPREASALRRDLIEVFRQYSIVWMWERSLVKRLQQDGVEAKYLPFAVDPELCRPQSVAEGLRCDVCNFTHDVAFVATYTRARCTEVAAIRKHTVAIWGNNWPRKWRTLSGQHRVHPPVWGSAVGDIYSRAAVSLNVLNAENLCGPNMRTFEVPGSGGVMLARFSAEQNEFFPENEAAVYYRSPAELDDKIEAVLRDPDLRSHIRRNAARLAAKQTYDVRAAHVLRECGLNFSSNSISSSSSASLGGPGGLT